MTKSRKCVHRRSRTWSQMIYQLSKPLYCEQVHTHYCRTVQSTSSNITCLCALSISAIGFYLSIFIFLKVVRVRDSGLNISLFFSAIFDLRTDRWTSAACCIQVTASFLCSLPLVQCGGRLLAIRIEGSR